ncbi:MAG: hypothetical protein AAFR04_15655 [Pseudomonadota bacterium]
MSNNDLVTLTQLKERVGSYRTGTSGALHDINLLPLAKLRRRQLSRLMMPLNPEMARKRVPDGDYLISRKLDGEFTLLIYRDGDVVSLNPYGTVRVGAPFHEEAARLLKAAGVRDAILIGELYVKWDDGRRERVHDVVRLARAPQSQEDVDRLRFAAFAIDHIDDDDLSARPLEAHDTLLRLLKGGERVHPIETIKGDRDTITSRFRQWVEDEGSEGVCALSPAHGWFKIKPRHTLDLAVIGFSQGSGERAEMLHSLLLALVREDGAFHIVGRTGGGFSDDERITLLADLKQRRVESAYTEVNSDRVAYAMIDPGLVAEIECLDVITRSSAGEPILRAVLQWDGEAKRWESTRRLPLASLISPQFIRLRDDKAPHADETGLKQLAALADVPEGDEAAAPLRLPEATLLRRAVATKELKGRTMVRKLLMWRTNKEEASDEHPAYVLLLTDFSPNRKTPLERDIRVSASAEQIEAYWRTWEEAKFVKGWSVQPSPEQQ